MCEKLIRTAYSQAVPLIQVVTQDAPATQRAILAELRDEAEVFAASPLFGLEALTTKAQENLGELTQGLDASMLADPATLLRSLLFAGEENRPRVVVWWGADRAWSDPDVANAILLVRDRLGAKGITLIGMGEAPIAGALNDHVHTVRDTLPNDETRKKIATELLESNSIQATPNALRQTVNLTRGLSRFGVEQVLSLAVASGSLDVQAVSAKWAETLSGLPGITVEKALPIEYFGGSEAWIAELESYKRAAPSLVVLLDEIEKLVPRAGTALDSGASDAIQGELLTYLNDSEPAGCIAEGVPGTGKSLSALVAASIFGCPVLRLNPARMKGGIVGESERNAERVFAVLRSFGGLQYWIATSNNLSTVPEELADRFPGGVWFFDLPSVAELERIWSANMMRYRTSDPHPPVAQGWTGRDVRAVCLEHLRKAQPLAQIASNRIPAARKMVRRIEKMRADATAEGYRSAATGRPYTLQNAQPVAVPRAIRKPIPATIPATDEREDMF